MTTTSAIEPLLERVLAGGTLSADERETLAASRDLLALGMAADEIRRRRHGDQVTFLRVAHVALDRVDGPTPLWEGSAGEVRLTGAPVDLPATVAAVRTVCAAAGQTPVTGFSLADLARAAGDARRLRAWCSALAEAGLAAVAEAPLDVLEAPEVAVAASLDAGLPVAALTIERLPDVRATLLERAAAVIAACPAVNVLAPLPRKVVGVSPSTGYEDVHLVALARLLVPVSHIQVDWQRYGPKLAQVALTFGADDVDAVSAVDEVAEGRRRSPLEEIRRNILAASGSPVERGTGFLVR
jgi:hypothetical protein